MTTHLHPDCTCNHKPGDPCNTTCPVHGIPADFGAGLYQWDGTKWIAR